MYPNDKNNCRLGLGVMRLKQNSDGTFPDDTRKFLHKAYKKGIRYFDTGYEYLKGKSEELIKEELVSSYPREQFWIADKMPVWKVESYNDLEQIFNEQLHRLGVEYIDYYLLHALNSMYWPKIKQKDVLPFL